MATLSIISWNMKNRSSNWETVLESGAEVALLQETSQLPGDYDNRVVLSKDENVGGSSPVALVAALSDRVDFTPVKTQPIGGEDKEALMVSRPGTIAAALVRLPESKEEITIASLYAFWAYPLKQTSSSWIYADASCHRLISDLSAFIGQQNRHKIIVAGDFNILYGYGEGNSQYWKRRYETVFDRMAVLGFRFMGPQAPGGGRQANPWPNELPADSKNVPTYYSNRQTPETAARQLDYVFASEAIADRVKVRALNKPEHWGPSDHCRIMIELEVK